MATWESLPRPEPLFWIVAAVSAAAVIPTLVLMAMDGRTIDGHVSVWTKPLKFELSLALHAATLALACSRLSMPYGEGLAARLTAVAFVLACIIEMGWIILQAGRGELSHFNLSTPFTQFMYGVMAWMAVIIVGAAGVLGVLVALDRGFDAPTALRWGIVLGFVGGTVLTLVTAFTIGARLGPYVGGLPAPDLRAALTGWSRSTGDLRVSHFLATHMIQAVPLAALLLDRVAAGRPALIATVAVAVLWGAVTLADYRQALSGAPSALARLLPQRG